MLFRGYIRTEMASNYLTIFIEDEIGYKTNLIARIQEGIINYGNKVTIFNFLSKEPMSLLDMITSHVNNITGLAYVEQNAHEVVYSEYTVDMNYETSFSVGGHNLYKALLSHAGEFIHFDITFRNKELGKDA